MAIRESLLDALNSIATSDFVRSVTYAGASSKVTVSNLAKTIIENYTGSTLAGSSQSVKSAIDAIGADVSGMLDSVYPVGSIYMSVNSTSPATLFGGTWVQIKGRFLLGTGTPDDNTNTYYGTDLTYDGTNKINETAKSTGGESRHTLASYEMPEHNHSRIVYNGNGEWTLADNYGIGGTQTDAYSAIIQYSGNIVYAQNTPASHFRTNEAGSSISHNNMPPYYSVYMWERTA